MNINTALITVDETSVRLNTLIKYRDACKMAGEIYLLPDTAKEELKVMLLTIESMIESMPGVVT